ncbi:hypothetical protein [Draconibacterium halophilum]|uniref:Lipoprotein n=1 Tax=Draconibacterium halophilum TaxID=2706887 RepID=A0A6C0RFK8_9BACT|nr:hypothetical protein [Draconibacterium halophilum]QIA08756.1 hypothetical protein G0Q07_13960 [Draconibacterium halophilum]
MKLEILKLSLVFLLFALIGASCQDEEELPPLKDKQLTVSEIKSQGCKDHLKSTDTERYIELKAEGENQLRVKFINATLNCAGLDTTYAMINDGILRVTFIDYEWANCICNFDLECVIDSMEQRKYTSKVSASGEVTTFTFHYSKNLDSTIEISPN